MSSRALVALAVVLVVLAGIAYLMNRPEQKPAVSGISAGDKILADVDINAVQRVAVTGAESPVELAKKEGAWVVNSLHAYPADFEKLADALRSLAELKVGQIIQGGEEFPEDYGLAVGESTSSPPVQITMYADGDSPAAELTMGAQRMPAPSGDRPSFPSGRYLRVKDGPIILVDDSLSSFTTESDNWIDTDLLDVSSSDTEEVGVTGTNGSYTLTFKEGSTYELKGLKDDEEIDTSAASRLGRALQYLRCKTIADPAKSDADLGFEQPSVFTLRTKDQVTYTVNVGSKAGDADDDRHIRIDVAYAKPPAPTREEVAKTIPEEMKIDEEPPGEGAEGKEPEKTREQKVDEALEAKVKEHEEKVAEQTQKVADLKKKFANWTYVVAGYQADNMLVPRDELAKKKEVEEPEDKEEEEAKQEPQVATTPPLKIEPAPDKSAPEMPEPEEKKGPTEESKPAMKEAKTEPAAEKAEPAPKPEKKVESPKPEPKPKPKPDKPKPKQEAKPAKPEPKADPKTALPKPEKKPSPPTSKPLKFEPELIEEKTAAKPETEKKPDPVEDSKDK